MLPTGRSRRAPEAWACSLETEPSRASRPRPNRLISVMSGHLGQRVGYFFLLRSLGKIGHCGALYWASGAVLDDYGAILHPAEQLLSNGQITLRANRLNVV